MTSVFIVEDEAFVALDLQQTVEGLGYEAVGTAANGADAITQIQSLAPDLVLMDIMLAGEMDGIEVAQKLREFHRQPIVFLTAYSDPTTINRMKATQPFGYIRKPYDEEVLRVSIELALYKFESEQALINSERRLATTLRSIGDGVITTDAKGNIEFINHVAQQLTGWTQAEARGQTFTTVFNIQHEKTGEPAINPINRVLAEGIVLGLANHTVVISKDGSIFPIDDSAAPIIDDDGNITGMVIVFRDITEKRESELLHRQSQRLDSLGLLAGGIAHDFNNILTTLLTQASLLHTRLAPNSWEGNRVDKITNSAERASALAKQLLNYSRKVDLEKAVVDLNQFLKESQSFLQTLRSRNLTIEMDLCHNTLCVLLDKVQFQQVLLNLVINAKEAIGSNDGLVVIQTSLVEYTEKQAEKFLAAERFLSGKFAQIQVTDNGEGMNRETRERIFDPFFTTKTQGNGLGLATTIGIVYGHDGAILVESEINDGTKFTILLPLQEEDTEAEDLPQAEAGTDSGALLVIDDEERILEAVTDILETTAVNILTETDAKKGIAIFQEKVQEISAVMIDVEMPTMNGLDALEEIRAINPEIKVILSSGYTLDGRLREVVNNRDVYFLAKPYNYDDFMNLMGLFFKSL